MTIPEQAASRAEAHRIEPGPASLLNRQQQQILRLLQNGDLIWEMADDPAHYTVYHEKRGRDQRVAATLVTALEEQGWIRKRPNLQSDRLDSWEITPEGRALLLRPQGRSRAGETGSCVGHGG
jgi:DNA-binding MarR family transcriptional regulator